MVVPTPRAGATIPAFRGAATTRHDGKSRGACRRRGDGSDVRGERPPRAASPTAYDEGEPVKYVILIHSNPDPWGHPTSSHTAEGRALPTGRHAEMARQFD